MVNIIIKKDFSHVNTAFSNWDTPKGKYIKSESHYKEEMKRGGYVTYEEAQQRNKNEQERRSSQKFKVSKPVLSILKEIKDKADKKGNVKLSDREIDAMKSMGLKTGKTIENNIKRAKENL